ncbi:MAG: type II secretion protein F, partial [Actinomyces oris]|uniref:type II secretion protein F n=2 Tax=Actinomyces oris TaxID=544580 RepID=UPI003623978B
SASLLLDGGLGSAVGALGIGLMVVGHLLTRRLVRAATVEGDVVDEALVLDLAAAALSAGASVPGVLTALGAALEEDGAGVVGRALLLGAPWEEAWQAPEDDQWRARRSRLESCLRPGWEDGASPAALLAATAASLRAGRHARDEEAAERLAVRLVLPLGACHLPAFVILGIAPVVASVGMSMLSG